MDINELIIIVKNKLLNQINIESINIEDKSFLHKNHKGNQEGKYHLKLIIVSEELKKMNKIESNKKIYKILDQELKEFIHSSQSLRITIQIPPTPLDLGMTPLTSKQPEECHFILRFILVIPSFSKQMLSQPSLTQMFDSLSTIFVRFDTSRKPTSKCLRTMDRLG